MESLPSSCPSAGQICLEAMGFSWSHFGKLMTHERLGLGSNVASRRTSLVQCGQGEARLFAQALLEGSHLARYARLVQRWTVACGCFPSTFGIASAQLGVMVRRYAPVDSNGGFFGSC